MHWHDKLRGVNECSGAFVIELLDSCNNSTVLEPGTTYQVSANIGLNFPGPGYVYGNKIQLFIDYNNDGDFADANESVYTSGSTCTNGTITFTFTTPSTVPVQDAILRMRAIAYSCSLSDNTGCSAPSKANVQDFGIACASSTILPKVRTACEG